MKLRGQGPTTQDGGNIIHWPRLTEPCVPLELRHYGPGEPGREHLEAFIHQVFLRTYAARISTFYPQLISLSQPDAAYAAVAGIRSAASGGLFAEHYLDAPIETLIADRTGESVARDAVVEVGNLAPANAGQARWLIATITAYLHACGFRWVAFTAVPALHNAFVRMGLRPLLLASARRERLDPALQDDWGSYYQANPQVYVGDILQGYQALHPLIGPDLPRLQRLWQAALATGYTHAMATQAVAAKVSLHV